MDFETPGALERLDTMDDAALDDLPFGVVGMSPDGRVVRFNRLESTLAGLGRDRVMGFNFFTEVAPCMNNFMVGQRFLDEPALDVVLAYVLTVRMRPTKVHLRLLKSDAARMYLLIRRQG